MEGKLKMNVQKLIAPYLEANTFILEKNGHVLIVDCGVPTEEIKQTVSDRVVDGVLLSHGHFDHSRFCQEYANAFHCKIFASSFVQQTMSDIEALYSEHGEKFANFSCFKFLDGDQTLQIGEFQVESYYCPGHSICSTCYKIENLLFAGDVLFDRSIGRTDLKYSDKNMMYQTLCKLDSISFERVYSGHGEESTYSEQKKNIAVYKRFLTR